MQPHLRLTLLVVAFGLNWFVMCEAVMSNSNDLLSEMDMAGCYSGERVWKMPRWKYFDDKVSQHHFAAHCVDGRGNSHACKIAALLKKFVFNTEWVHMDVHWVGLKQSNKNFQYKKNLWKLSLLFYLYAERLFTQKKKKRKKNWIEIKI